MGPLPHIVEDCMGVLQLYSDGTVHRRHVDFLFNAVVDDTSVSFDDVIFDEQLGLSVRIYRPKSVHGGRLPVLFYFHGGGFCVGSRLWPNFHGCCLRLASGLEAVVMSPDYRLAPEHRLPAAVDDAEKAVQWLALQAASPVAEGSVDQDPRRCHSSCNSSDDNINWLREVVDLNRVFVLGDSSGGNMAHHLAVRLGSGSGSGQLGLARVKGFVLLAPFFGGVVRTRSEEGPSESILNLEILDRFWRLSVPEGETRDHPFANPFGPKSPNLEKVDLEPILAVVGGKELLKDRVEYYADKLKKMGKKIEYVEFEDEEHGFLTKDPNSDTSSQLLHLIKRFMLENSK